MVYLLDGTGDEQRPHLRGFVPQLCCIYLGPCRALLNVSINRVGVEGRKWEVLDWGDVTHIAAEVGDDVVP